MPLPLIPAVAALGKGAMALGAKVVGAGAAKTAAVGGAKAASTISAGQRAAALRQAHGKRAINKITGGKIPDHAKAWSPSKAANAAGNLPSSGGGVDDSWKEAAKRITEQAKGWKSV